MQSLSTHPLRSETTSGGAQGLFPACYLGIEPWPPSPTLWDISLAMAFCFLFFWPHPVVYRVYSGSEFMEHSWCAQETIWGSRNWIFVGQMQGKEHPTHCTVAPTSHFVKNSSFKDLSLLALWSDSSCRALLWSLLSYGWATCLGWQGPSILCFQTAHLAITFWECSMAVLSSPDNPPTPVLQSAPLSSTHTAWFPEARIPLASEFSECNLSSFIFLLWNAVFLGLIIMQLSISYVHSPFVLPFMQWPHFLLAAFPHWSEIFGFQGTSPLSLSNLLTITS